MAREISNELIERTLMEPESIVKSRGDRFVAQRLFLRPEFGELLIRVIYEEVNDEKVVITAYWARPERCLRKERYEG